MEEEAVQFPWREVLC